MLAYGNAAGSPAYPRGSRFDADGSDGGQGVDRPKRPPRPSRVLPAGSAFCDRAGNGSEPGFFLSTAHTQPAEGPGGPLGTARSVA
jgi:hypothetical protein